MTTDHSASSQTAPLQRFHRRIAEKMQELAARTVIIVALGDSVTAGAAAEGELLHDDVYHAQFKRQLEARYPGALFSVVNAGVGGESAAGGLARLERDVLCHRPDLVLIGFGLNDAAGGELAGLAEYAAHLDALIDGAAEAGADIVLLTPNMMPYRESSNIPERWRHVTDKFIRLQTEGILAAYAQCVRDAGARRDVPVADVYAAWEAFAARGGDPTAMLANGLNHPDAAGHGLAAETIFQVVLESEHTEPMPHVEPAVQEQS